MKRRNCPQMGLYVPLGLLLVSVQLAARIAVFVIQHLAHNLFSVFPICRSAVPLPGHQVLWDSQPRVSMRILVILYQAGIVQNHQHPKMSVGELPW